VIDVWYLIESEIPDAVSSKYRALLASDELTRMDRYVFERHRREYLFTRALVRTVLSTYAPEIAPAEWRFGKNEYDRPHVADGLPQVTFNVSNSNGVIVCAVSTGGEIGVDVEPFDRADQILGVAETVFSVHERADLARLSPDARKRHAVALWTSKEAYIKARAIGLSLRLEKISIRPGGGISFEGIVDLPERWSFSLHEPVPSHLIAVCAERVPAGASPEVALRKTVPLAAPTG
jgi:4'-phosphopantetheinyl transferase